jgi:hypothetical protein
MAPSVFKKNVLAIFIIHGAVTECQTMMTLLDLCRHCACFFSLFSWGEIGKNR